MVKFSSFSSLNRFAFQCLLNGGFIFEKKFTIYSYFNGSTLFLLLLLLNHTITLCLCYRVEIIVFCFFFFNLLQHIDA